MLKRNLYWCGLGLILLVVSSVAHGQTPDVIHYRGHLDVPTVVPAGTVQRELTFNLYEMEIGGSPIWTETQILDIYDGNFAAVLGSINSVTEELFASEYRYLGVQVGADPELTPRQRIAAVPYSMVAAHAIRAASADDADTLGGGVVSVAPFGASWTIVDVNAYLRVQEPSFFMSWLGVGGGPDDFSPNATLHATTYQLESQPSEMRRFRVSTLNETPTGARYFHTHLIVDEDGYVGINDPSPSGNLDVNGTIYQRGGVLHPDYVFEDDYTIDSIEDHAEKMWEGKHLPAIPPREYDDEGREMVEIGRQRTGILEELEIAHIYIEQLNKKISELEKKIEKLEEKNEDE
jgi:hypothetical protein